MLEMDRLQLNDGASVLVKDDEDAVGIGRVRRGRDGVRELGRRLSEALAGVRDTAGASVQTLRVLSPEGLELEFGVKLTGEASAIIAKTAAEGHFTVKLSWRPGGAP